VIWTADDGDLRVLVRPGQRAVVLFRGSAQARPALLDAALAECTARGFRRHRREHNYAAAVR
jgi:hypothetical protein